MLTFGDPLSSATARVSSARGYGLRRDAGVSVMESAESQVFRWVGLAGFRTRTRPYDWPSLRSSDRIVLGLIAGLVPALSAYRAKITDILRTV